MRPSGLPRLRTCSAATVDFVETHWEVLFVESIGVRHPVPNRESPLGHSDECFVPFPRLAHVKTCAALPTTNVVHALVGYCLPRFPLGIQSESAIGITRPRAPS